MQRPVCVARNSYGERKQPWVFGTPPTDDNIDAYHAASLNVVCPDLLAQLVCLTISIWNHRAVAFEATTFAARGLYLPALPPCVVESCVDACILLASPPPCVVECCGMLCRWTAATHLLDDSKA